MGATFLNCNRNKRGLVLDLKKTSDKDTLLSLAKEAHVLLHNMRPAAMERLGLSYDALRKVNSSLIYCAIVGYGQDGRYRNRPAYDDIIQGASGWAGLDRKDDGTPKYAPTVMADKIAGLYAMGAINAALLYRQRTGEGQYVEVPMFETLASFLLVEHLGGQTFQPPEGGWGYARLLSRHRRPYRTNDGYISVLPYNMQHWISFFKAVGRDDWADDPRLKSDSARADMIDDLYHRLSETLASRSTDHWMSILLKEDIPCSPVRSIEDLWNDEHLRDAEFFVSLDHPTEGAIVTTRPPIRFSRTPCRVTLGAPARSEAHIKEPIAGHDMP